MTTRLLLALTMILSVGCSNVIRSGLMNSNSILLPPSSERTLYLQARNTSENQQITLGGLGSRLATKGYRLVTDPEQAAYWVQTQVVYCHKAAQGAKPETVAKAGYGTGIGKGGTVLPTSTDAGRTAGMVPGMIAGMGGMPDINAMMAAAMRGGMPSAPPRDETIAYLCVADVQVTERDNSATTGMPKLYTMRSVAHVLQKKLDIEEATPIIQEKLTTGIAGPF